MASELKRIPFPVPDFHTNPPGPMCVVLNLPNWFFVTPPSTAPITTTILGTPVTLYPRVDSYTFDFGDGSAPLVTSDPGGPYPDGANQHVYEVPGHYQAVVTVTWAADWEAAGVPRQPVPGTASTASAPTEVWAHEYKIVLVADPNGPPPVLPGADPADPCLNGG